MRIVAAIGLLLFCMSGGGAEAQITNFEHVVVIIQENRTPDNLFQGLCSPSSVCSTTPNSSQYDIQTANWLDKSSPGGVIQPATAPLNDKYDLDHTHASFLSMCDMNTSTATCRMDGAAGIVCSPEKGATCLPNPQFRFVADVGGILGPYLDLARQYGWANYMFETNQGPSFPAHQFLFGATSAPNPRADHDGYFVAENPAKDKAGCPAGLQVQVITPSGDEDPRLQIAPCLEHQTVADILTSYGFTWRYYTGVDAYNSIWAAPNSIGHLCGANTTTLKCTSATWAANVDVNSSDVLTNIAHCKLANVSWVVPIGQNSDHPVMNNGGGPSWVASIVNAIGNSKCTDGSPAKTYWADTAIFILWDDWGGWYDHVAPTILSFPEGNYQYGFRVPFIAVSAYTPKGYIDNGRYDFGSIVRFIEHNFLIHEGILTFADARSTTDLLSFFNLSQPARTFETIPAPLDANYFINDKSTPLPPDDD